MQQDSQFSDIPLLGDVLNLTAALVRLAAVLLARRPPRRPARGTAPAATPPSDRHGRANAGNL
jgi:hypothetical protein